MLFGWINSLFRFRHKDKYKLDGPGMVNPFNWLSIYVYRIDSYAQHNFDITIEAKGKGYIVKGCVRDNDGTIYENEEGIILPSKVVRQIIDLYPAELPDVKCKDSENSQTLDNELIILDETKSKVILVYLDKTKQEKVDSNNFSLKVYNIVLPCFRKG